MFAVIVHSPLSFINFPLPLYHTDTISPLQNFQRVKLAGSRLVELPMDLTSGFVGIGGHTVVPCGFSLMIYWVHHQSGRALLLPQYSRPAPPVISCQVAHFTFTKAKMNYARYSYIKMSPWVMIYLWKSLSYHISGSITYLTSVIKCVVLFSTFDSFFVLCCILGTPHHEIKI